MFNRKDTAVIEKEQQLTRVNPVCDISETGDGFRIEAELPGCSKQGVSLKLERGVLEISARPDISLTRGVISCDEEVLLYKRSFKLGQDIDQDAISAEVENGILTVELPRKESEKPRQINLD